MSDRYENEVGGEKNEGEVKLDIPSGFDHMGGERKFLEELYNSEDYSMIFRFVTGDGWLWDVLYHQLMRLNNPPHCLLIDNFTYNERAYTSGRDWQRVEQIIRTIPCIDNYLTAMEEIFTIKHGVVNCFVEDNFSYTKYRNYHGASFQMIISVGCIGKAMWLKRGKREVGVQLLHGSAVMLPITSYPDIEDIEYSFTGAKNSWSIVIDMSPKGASWFDDEKVVQIYFRPVFSSYEMGTSEETQQQLLDAYPESTTFEELITKYARLTGLDLSKLTFSYKNEVIKFSDVPADIGLVDLKEDYYIDVTPKDSNRQCLVFVNEDTYEAFCMVLDSSDCDWQKDKMKVMFRRYLGVLHEKGQTNASLKSLRFKYNDKVLLPSVEGKQTPLSLGISSGDTIRVSSITSPQASSNITTKKSKSTKKKGKKGGGKGRGKKKSLHSQTTSPTAINLEHAKSEEKVSQANTTPPAPTHARQLRSVNDNSLPFYKMFTNTFQATWKTDVMHNENKGALPINHISQARKAIGALVKTWKKHPEILTNEDYLKDTMELLVYIGTESLERHGPNPHVFGIGGGILYLEQCQKNGGIILPIADELLLKIRNVTDCCERTIYRFYSKRTNSPALDEKFAAVKDQPKTGICDYCFERKERCKLGVCSFCRGQQYCSKKCLKAHWSEHQKVCSRFHV